MCDFDLINKTRHVLLEEEPESSRARFSSRGREAPKGSGGDRKVLPAVKKMPNNKDGCPMGGCDFHRGTSRNEPEPRFAEEDYIVFCFREDGEIDMINEGNYKKYNYEDEIDDDDHEHVDIIATTTLRPMINRKKGDEKVRVEKGIEGQPNGNEVKEIDSIEQPNSASKMDSFESCDSNLSDTTSTSSFAFPVLGLDWIGSPVHMPVSEKPDCPSLSLRCCSF
ncbi:Protein BREAKING OF ASYMMETRY IN THE STOMATAL LINEAGE [Striga hermonthica]|uniref:Protein BREAKING OF ASYMMETRY IN THE STOMATAL LINEAGE n=1 Tax=Striga hermonthica TaxID=68872 RepID=A0A9N7NV09_STRHE|nr:Protein BREAKING OF ASYMMETRY IN THE STOMATAL LINEAGE [Striga hermonthica]